MTISRAYIDYAKASAAPAGKFVGFDPDRPIAGFYRMRLRSGAAFCGIRIWYGPPHDPVTGEELDRSWRWQAEANGEAIDFDRAWPKCAGSPINAAEYHHLCSVQEWARENAPDSALADPHRRADPLETPLLF